jgi:hypothetical protein
MIEWTHLSDMPAPVHFHGSACVDKLLFTIAGVRREQRKAKFVPLVHALNMTSNTFWSCEDIPEAIMEPGIAVVEKDILAVGGWNGKTYIRKTFKLNTRTLKWTTCSPVPGSFTHTVPSSTVAVDKMVFVLHRYGFLQYDVAVDQWNELTPPPKLFTWCALVPKQGKLMALGGYESALFTSNDHIQTFENVSQTWKLEKMRMPVALSRHWAVVLRNLKG